MTSHIIKIKQCPNCDCIFTVWGAASCNTFGAHFYTDGFVVGPIYDEGNAVLTCPGCNKYLWQNDVPTKQSMREEEFFLEIEKSSLPIAGRLGGRDYENLLDQAFWRTEIQEKYIRIRAWWSFNSDYRAHFIDKEFCLSSEQLVNLKKLLKLWDTNNPKESIMKAEIFRQLGEFDECLNQLDQVYDDRLKARIDIIWHLLARLIPLVENNFNICELGPRGTGKSHVY